MQKVIMYGRHSKKPLVIGTETECVEWIFKQASEDIKLPDGRMIYREIHDPAGIAYDVGGPVLYQVVEATDADGNEGIYQSELTADGKN